jgi:hypothetical protein
MAAMVNRPPRRVLSPLVGFPEKVGGVYLPGEEDLLTKISNSNFFLHNSKVLEIFLKKIFKKIIGKFLKIYRSHFLYALLESDTMQQRRPFLIFQCSRLSLMRTLYGLTAQFFFVCFSGGWGHSVVTENCQLPGHRGGRPP